MDTRLKAQYDAWKTARVVDASVVVAGGYADKINVAGDLCRSEGIGYGMVITCLFAGHDPNARTVFDGMLAVARARPAYSTGQTALMAWRIYTNGLSSDGWNAMDGDLDIAYALLMADRQWGSTGTWNYKQEAINTINAMKAYNFKTDGTTKGMPIPDASRTSDYMLGHFKAFKKATGDTFWDTAYNRAQYIINRIQTVNSPTAGLMPDFVINTQNLNPDPSYAGYIPSEGIYQGDYYYNACRCPWRWASDYLLTGDVNTKTYTMRMMNFIKAQTAAPADIYAIGDGYHLDGTMFSPGDSAAFFGPFLAGACVDATLQTLCDQLWNWNSAHQITGYYDSEIQIMSMALASGNWWTP